MNNNILIIRQLNEEDIGILAQTFCFPWTNIEDSTKKWKMYFQDSINKSRFVVVIESNHDLIGYGSLLFNSKYSFFKESNIPEINDIWIKETHRRKGLGKKLINFLENKAISMGYKKIGIGVGLYNDYGSAQKLYCKLGYIPDGRGVTYKYFQVKAGKSLPIDDELILWFEKSLKSR